MLTVEVRQGVKCDEELRRVGVAPGVGHREQTLGAVPPRLVRVRVRVRVKVKMRVRVRVGVRVRVRVRVRIRDRVSPALPSKLSSANLLPKMDSP